LEGEISQYHYIKKALVCKVFFEKTVAFLRFFRGTTNARFKLDGKCQTFFEKSMEI